MSKAREVITGALRTAFRPAQKLTPSEWCERNIRLPAKSSSLPGRFSFSSTPYMREIYDELDNPRTERIAIMKATQVGASLFIANAVAYYICNKTLPLGVYFPSDTKGREFADEKLQPILSDCDKVKEFRTGRAHDERKTDIEFTSCIVRVIGAGNAAKLSSNSFAAVFLDEADKWKLESGGEAKALHLAEKRTLSFGLGDKKIVLCSSPTSTDESQIYEAYKDGSCGVYYCPCPKCNHEQELVFEGKRQSEGDDYEGGVVFKDAKRPNGTYDYDKLEAVTYYQCCACKAKLTEQDRVYMVNHGRWIHSNPNAPAGFRSYQISRLMSLQTDTTLASIAREWLTKCKDIAGKHDFTNNVLGQPWAEKAASVAISEIEEIVKASPFVKKGVLLDKPDFLAVSVDTQGDGFWYSVTALYRDDSLHVVDWGFVGSFAEATKLVDRTYPIAGTPDYARINKGVIDTGYKTTLVYDLINNSARRFVGVKGQQKTSEPVYENSVVYKGVTMPLLHVNDPQFKFHLYINTIKNRTQKLILPADTDFTLKEQLTCAYLANVKDSNGKFSTVWRYRDKNEHLGDTLKYTMGLLTFLTPAIQRMRADEMKAKETPANEQAAQRPRQYVLNGTYGGGW